MALTSDQEEKLSLFKEITSYSEDDHAKVINLLEQTAWNLEVAIPRFFDGNFADDVPNIVEPPEGVATGAEFTENFGDLHTRRRASLPQTQRLASPLIDFQDHVPRFPKAVAISESWKFKLGLPPRHSPQSANGPISPLMFIFMLVPKAVLLLLTGLRSFFEFLFPGFTEIFGFSQNPASYPSEPNIFEIQPNFQQRFDQLIEYNKEDAASVAKRLIFQEGEYNDAYNLSKTELRWLVVVLVNEATIQGLQSLSATGLFKSFVEKNNALVWGGDVDYIEPFEVGRSFKARRLPQLFLIANVSKAGEFPLMSVANKCSVSMDVSVESARIIFKRFQKTVDMYEPQLVSQRYDKSEAELSRRLRQEQDDAYHRSLLADKAKMEAKLEQRRHEEEAAVKGKLKEEERLKRIKLRESYLVLKSIELLESQDIFEKGNHTTIQFRLNTGERLLQKFLSTKTLYDIFLYVDCKLFLKAFKDDIKDDAELLDVLRLEKQDEIEDLSSYEHEYKFELIQPIPRVVLKPDDKAKVGDVKEIWPNGNLLVEFDADDDDGDDDNEEET